MMSALCLAEIKHRKWRHGNEVSMTIESVTVIQQLSCSLALAVFVSVDVTLPMGCTRHNTQVAYVTVPIMQFFP